MLVRLWFRSTFSLVPQLAYQSFEEALTEEQLRSAGKWPTKTSKQKVGQTGGPKGRRVNPSFVIVVTLSGSPNPADLVSAPICSPLEPLGGALRGAAAAAWRHSAR